MFLEELADLKDRYPSRLALHHVLSREQRTAPLLSGRIDAEQAAPRCSTRSSARRRSTSGSCAGRSSSSSCAATRSADVGVTRATRPLRAVHHRRAASRADGDAGRPVVVAPSDETVRRSTFTLDGQSVDGRRARSRAHESILNAALRVRPDVPFACAGGVCGTCRARLVAGSVG